MKGKTMNRSLMTVMCLVVFACSAALAQQQGKVLQNSMPSSIIGRDIQYTVYLPPDFDISNRTYPVFYLMHGGNNDDYCWFQKGNLAHTMDSMIASGKITPMVVVTPLGRRNPENKPLTFYMNDHDGAVMWAEMFIKEFVPYIEKTYRGVDASGRWRDARRPARVIGGLSMGGYGALMFSMQNPGMFAATIASSPGLYTENDIKTIDQDGFERRFALAFGSSGKEGSERITEEFYKQHPLGLMTRVKPEDLKKLNIFIDCGAEDRFDEGSYELHLFLRKAGVQHKFVIRPGGHNWIFWRESLPNMLEFANAALTR